MSTNPLEDIVEFDIKLTLRGSQEQQISVSISKTNLKLSAIPHSVAGREISFFISAALLENEDFQKLVK